MSVRHDLPVSIILKYVNHEVASANRGKLSLIYASNIDYSLPIRRRVVLSTAAVNQQTVGSRCGPHTCVDVFLTHCYSIRRLEKPCRDARAEEGGVITASVIHGVGRELILSVS